LEDNTLYGILALMRKSFLVAASASLMLLQGCHPSLHVFNTTNAPCISAKNEGTVNGFFGTEHAELQGAVSPIDKWSVMFNGYLSFRENPPVSLGHMKGTCLYEGAVGRYGQFKKPKEGLLGYEVYAGGGYGERQYRGLAFESFPYGGNSAPIYKLQSSYFKGFIQGSAFLKKDKADFSFTAQVAYLHYPVLDLKVVNVRAPEPYHYRALNTSLYNLNLALTSKRHISEHFSLIFQLATNFTSPQVQFEIPERMWLGNARFIFNSRPVEANFGFALRFK
jgi:hypothetical protein